MRKLSLSIVLLWLGLLSYAQVNYDYCQDYKNVLKTFRDYSLRPIDMNSLDNNLFLQNFLESLDPNQVILDVTDVERIKASVNKFKQDPENAYCNERKMLVDIYKRNIDSSIILLEEMRAKKPDFSRSDSVPSGQSFEISGYNPSHAQRWKSYLKLRVLQDMLDNTTSFDSLNKEPGWFNKTVNQEYAKVIDQETSRLKRILGSKPDFESSVFFSYVNSMLMQFDPHTYYFSKESFTDFREQLSSFSDSYGIQIEMNKNGRYYVSGIIPGSYSWRTGQINVGDELLEIATDNRAPVKLEYATDNDLVNYLSASSTDIITLTVQNKSGQHKTVTLHKEKLQNTENELQAYILKGKNKIGYIYLPAFYTSWESDNNAGCAQDMAKALYSLKKDTVQAVILDLRNNGGGSIKEALELAGIFVDFGILSIQQDRTGQLYPLRDMNRGTMYSGPLAILVNQGSASASEMVAAVLQDYHRAVIIGTSTFGKASGQIMLPVGQFPLSSKKADINEMNTLKITVNKFYRVTGSSYQRTGVTPDIILPGLASFHTESEARYPDALGNDSLTRKIFFNALPPIPLGKLKSLSEQRLAGNQKFNLIKQLDKDMEKYMGRYSYIPLKLSAYYSYIRTREQLEEKLQANSDSISEEFRVQDVSQGKNLYNFYKVYPALHKGLMKAAASDPFIEEAFNVMHDYIHMPK